MTRILVFLISGDWLGIARLPQALAKADFDVTTLSPTNSHLAATQYANRHVLMPAGTKVLAAFFDTIAATQPDLVVPGCEQAVTFLHMLIREKNSTPDNVRALLLRSLGNPDHYAATLSKHKTLAAAAALGVRVPAQAPVDNVQDVWQFAALHAYPVVLKAEFGAAGSGVRICHAATEAGSALTGLTTRAPGRVAPRIAVQQYIQGTMAMQQVTAMAGDVLEHLSAEKLAAHPASVGPSSVVRFIEHAGMDTALDALLGHFGFSGFGGADFIIDADRQAWLLEFNPRPTPISHLGAAAGHDIVQALWCRLNGVRYERQRPAQPLGTVALFPQEIVRDANSPWLADTFHDVPADDPSLLASLQAHARRANPALR